MELTNQQIIEISENLDLGMDCFYNYKTGEVKTTMETDDFTDDEESPWGKDIKEIEDNSDDYYQFEKVTSNQSFSIMREFAEAVANIDVSNRLINALSNSKPFRNFKWQIDNSGEHRQKWFDYKRICEIKFLREQINENELY